MHTQVQILFSCPPPNEVWPSISLGTITLVLGEVGGPPGRIYNHPYPSITSADRHHQEKGRKPNSCQQNGQYPGGDE